ncbi:MAG TPA: hypothetical protein VH643_01190, partial [Gemmataceae bacterium]
GDSASHDAVFRQTRAQASSGNITEVAEIAKLYADNYASFRRERAERIHLYPRGLDLGTLVACQNNMNPQLLFELDRLLQDENLGVGTIICGVDEEPHIYSISDPGVMTCHDSIGFCAIGFGARQFETLFMYRGYSPFWDWLQALLLMYTAKKRAESSPGVGKYTDFYYFKGNEPGSGFLTPECLGALECYYEELRATNKMRFPGTDSI